MAIQGPFPDGGYELWCPECCCKITCFGPEELKNINKRRLYENFVCSDCLPILKKDTESQKYLKEKLTELADKFEEISIRYQFDEKDKTHIVEITPVDIFASDEAYQKDEGKISYKFDKKFYPENVLFISENSLTQITNSQFTLNDKMKLL